MQLLRESAPKLAEISAAASNLGLMLQRICTADGIGLVPAERHANAAFLDTSLRENVSIVGPGAFRRRGLLSKGREVSEVQDWLQRLRRELEERAVRRDVRADPSSAAPLIPLYLRRPDATPPAVLKAVSRP